MKNFLTFKKEIEDTLSEYYEILDFSPISNISLITRKQLDQIHLPIRCKTCNTETTVSIKGIFRKDHKIENICKECMRLNRIKLEYSKLTEKLLKYDLLPETFIDNYKSFKDWFSVKCKNCGKIFNIHPANTNYCSCHSTRKEDISSKLIDRFNEKYKSEFKILDYNMKLKTGTIEHLKCGNTFNKTVNSFYRNPNCPICKSVELQKKSFNNLSVILSSRFPEFELISFSGHWNNDAVIKHLECGYIFNIRPENMLLRGRCPQCDKDLSVGSKTIKRYLEKNNIPFEVEYSFNDLKDKYRLRFDFAIKDSDNNLFALIEFDGIQHFSIEKGFFGSSLDQQIKDLEYIQRHDKMKDEYCNRNNIKLYRIRYDDNIKEKLKLLFNDYPDGSEILQQEQGQMVGEIPLNRNNNMP